LRLLFDRDSTSLLLCIGRFRQGHCKRAILETRFNLVGLDIGIERDGALKTPIGALDIGAPVRDRATLPQSEPPFRRFPTWMWRNTDVERFIEEVRAWNLQRNGDERAGIYGLDLYSLSAFMRAVLDYLDKVDPVTAKVARRRYVVSNPTPMSPSSTVALRSPAVMPNARRLEDAGRTKSAQNLDIALCRQAQGDIVF
jgi:hypothetical protein